MKNLKKWQIASMNRGSVSSREMNASRNLKQLICFYDQINDYNKKFAKMIDGEDNKFTEVKVWI